MVVRLQFPGRCPVALGRTEIVAATRECHNNEAKMLRQGGHCDFYVPFARRPRTVAFLVLPLST